MAKSIQKRNRKRPWDYQLFRFTPNDLNNMREACRQSVEFMRDFGKGRKPYMVDMRYYHNPILPPKDKDEELFDEYESED